MSRSGVHYLLHLVGMSDMLQLVGDDADSGSEERVSDDRQAEAYRTFPDWHPY
jgi:hypothetical protein